MCHSLHSVTPKAVRYVAGGFSSLLFSFSSSFVLMWLSNTLLYYSYLFISPHTDTHMYTYMKIKFKTLNVGRVRLGCTLGYMN